MPRVGPPSFRVRLRLVLSQTSPVDHVPSTREGSYIDPRGGVERAPDIVSTRCRGESVGRAPTDGVPCEEVRHRDTPAGRRVRSPRPLRQGLLGPAGEGWSRTPPLRPSGVTSSFHNRRSFPDRGGTQVPRHSSPRTGTDGGTLTSDLRVDPLPVTTSTVVLSVVLDGDCPPSVHFTRLPPLWEVLSNRGGWRSGSDRVCGGGGPRRTVRGVVEVRVGPWGCRGPGRTMGGRGPGRTVGWG